MFSQNDEEKHILNYFKDYIGTFLDIGAYDGITLSNTYRLSLLGWKGICIEPSPKVYEKLSVLYKDNKNIRCLNLAIGTINGKSTFYDNHDALATLKQEELKRWEKTNHVFNPIEVDVMTFEKFYNNPFNFDFINIDAEGMDFDILRQIDLNSIGCKLLCIEYNSINPKIYIDYCNKFDMKLIHKNAENLIFAR